MLDLVTVLTKGGLVLWSKAYTNAVNRPGSEHPVDSVIQDILIEEKSNAEGYVKESYQVKWTFANELGLIFVIVYQKILQLAYIDDLLEGFKRLFCKQFSEEICDKETLHRYEGFDESFETLLRALEADYAQQAQRSKAPRKFQDTAAFQNTLAGSKQKEIKDTSASEKVTNGTSSTENLDQKLAALGLGKKGGRKSATKRGGRSSVGSRTGSDKSESESSPAVGKRKKEARTWVGGVAGTVATTNLDYSEEKEPAVIGSTRELIGSHMGTLTRDGLYDAADMDEVGQSESESEDEDLGGMTASEKPKAGGFMSFINRFTTGQVLTQEQLEPVMVKMREHMINKNVAADVADHVCESVANGLAGKTLSGFKSLTAAVRDQMETALSRVLTPRSSTDVLRDILAAKAEKRPYTITFVGVNGVGKSTNLSKVCFWLLQNKLKILIAACDTFRSGAVEQLRVHERNLRAVLPGSVVDLYDRGYGKDPAGIAKDAVAYAHTHKYDVVLIDTAGRMQDNEPLMRALAKLVAVNQADKVIFVGEALVGNEAVDQLVKFNQALKDFSGMQNPRQIDGMILTKFDTIDDKVGAALSMTYITGKPILFVGTGQTYTDLRKMNVKSIVTSLLGR
ncbi:hypothetical protein HDU85_006465 [Gaertneriomyces sp. JEL0708]|nr:hypothetical protein HDU85_006465 [Gaertneriomyces sp. JEL0708]